MTSSLKYAGLGASVSESPYDDVAWGSPHKINEDDSVLASAITIPNTLLTEILKATTFGFAIPAGAKILGIVVEVEKYKLNGNLVDGLMQLTKNGTVRVGNDKKDSSTHWVNATETIATYGGATDLWNTTWTANEINASTFGVHFAALGHQLATGDAYVDYIRITVYYSTVTHYTLTAEAGSYTKTGQGAGLKAARRIAAAASSYSLTGQSVSLKATRKMVAGAGSYSLTGQSAVLRAARRMTALSDSYPLTGQTVALKLARKLPAGAGSYSLTGQGPVLRAIRKMAAEGGSYVLTGQAANLVIGQHYILTAEQGYYGEPYSKIFVTLDGRIYKKMGNTYLRLS